MAYSLPPEDLIIFSTKDSSGKIYIREQSGFYQRIRRALSWLLMALFIGIPFIQYNGEQAFRINAGQQTIELFSIILFPQDFLIAALLFTLAAFVLFYVTRLYGRVWCGYTCPQTVWTLMFVWIERRIEGSHNQSRQLDNARFSPNKLAKKLAKHLSWLVVSVVTALVFMSYFIPQSELYSTFFALQAAWQVYAWVGFFALCTYFNAGLIREKMCLHMCPYSRFQSAMFNTATKLVSYNAGRGETRGPRKRGSDKPANLGDCVDCNLCVQVCPVGIDIRDGMQYECINCGLCIDACDQTMSQFGYAKGLINYAAEQSTGANLSGHLAYGVTILVTLVAILGWAMTRTNTELTVYRERNALYRVNTDGAIENTFTLNVINKTKTARQYQLQVEGMAYSQLNSDATLSLQAGEQRQFVVSINTMEKPATLFTPFKFVLLDIQNAERVTELSQFYSGNIVAR
ncbi:cytochrome c oxidase accessory protein FixG [Rheinheimera pacifica]|uniref:cytochrome c oxidase accessory protein CcoG n=1 Tax=Rheinheimera pacifica TaxID=173990 RepID=UPI0028549026|nr:cytochrome c oxidase accessory protein CcoG [Rheinheimera pacifica]MDR6984539.1 cytochrome c oxidase accessory protein FixG [Rheinheimera pacifica]